MPVDLDTWSLKIQKPVMLNYKTRQKAEVANTELDKLFVLVPVYFRFDSSVICFVSCHLKISSQNVNHQTSIGSLFRAKQ